MNTSGSGFSSSRTRRRRNTWSCSRRYIDDPQRDEIVAREMGWVHLSEEEGDDWNEDVENFLDETGR